MEAVYRLNGSTAPFAPARRYGTRDMAVVTAAVETESGSKTAIAVANASKAFRLPVDRPSTMKQRVLHPRQSRAASILQALDDVSFEIAEGEFFGIIGRNGSGKSTLLKCLAGIYRLRNGSIAVNGRVSPFIELGVGFNPELTARDNVVVNAALLGIPRSQALDSFEEIIEFAELEEFVDLKLKNYSSGMQVRLGFSAMIQADAEIYLVDEVLAVGDARFQEKCFEVFRNMKREGKTVVFVTHDMGTVERFCDRAVLLERGKLVSEGDPTHVIMTYRQANLELELQAEGKEVSEGTGEQRWGDRSAEILDAWFERGDGTRVSIVEQGERVRFRMHVRFNQAHPGPVFGVVLKNEHGHPVFATNTLVDATEVGDFSAGDEVTYTVSFDAIMSANKHIAAGAVAYQDRERFADWREGAATLSVRADHYTGGDVDLPHDTSVERAS